MGYIMSNADDPRIDSEDTNTVELRMGCACIHHGGLICCGDGCVEVDYDDLLEVRILIDVALDHRRDTPHQVLLRPRRGAEERRKT